ncbi:hypothetical protein QJS66_06495 [Kocuria rhizophila]|nr:hypothetical protein QJS66_06495 [Kocuria rhizophila]
MGRLRCACTSAAWGDALLRHRERARLRPQPVSGRAESRTGGSCRFPAGFSSRCGRHGTEHVVLAGPVRVVATAELV